jgi:hypothetical protein
MISEVCAFYGWTVEYVLSMPACRFFVMLEQSRTVDRRRRVQDCYIARAAQLSDQGFQHVVNQFDPSIVWPEEEIVSTPETPKEPLKGDTAKSAVMAAFAMDRSINRTMRTH